MAATGLAPAAPPHGIAHSRREGTSSWPLIDRLGYWACWATGIALALIAAWIVIFMLIKGLSYFRLSLLTESPAPSSQQTKSGGFLDPIEGTLIVTVLGTLIAGPLGVA